MPEAYETSLAFFHEINNTIFDEDTPFIEEASTISQNSDDIEAMIKCKLVISADKDIGYAANYLLAKWYKSLSYSSPLFERIDRFVEENGQRVEIFTFKEGCGCSFVFLLNYK